MHKKLYDTFREKIKINTITDCMVFLSKFMKPYDSPFYTLLYSSETIIILHPVRGGGELVTVSFIPKQDFDKYIETGEHFQILSSQWKSITLKQLLERLLKSKKHGIKIQKILFDVL